MTMGIPQSIGEGSARVRIVMSMIRSLFCLALLVGCGDKAWSGVVPTPDALTFETQVYPVLLRDCGFNGCHGGPHRFFQVFGPGRVRWDPLSKQDDPPTMVEVQVSYQRALSMLVTEGCEPPEQSLLLKKPLELRAGGIGHKGIDALGRNVYQTPTAPGYVALLLWAGTGTVPAVGSQPGAGVGGIGLGGAGGVAGVAGAAGGLPVAGSRP